MQVTFNLGCVRPGFHGLDGANDPDFIFGVGCCSAQEQVGQVRWGLVDLHIYDPVALKTFMSLLDNPEALLLKAQQAVLNLLMGTPELLLAVLQENYDRGVKAGRVQKAREFAAALEER